MNSGALILAFSKSQKGTPRPASQVEIIVGGSLKWLPTSLFCVKPPGKVMAVDDRSKLPRSELLKHGPFTNAIFLEQ